MNAVGTAFSTLALMGAAPSHASARHRPNILFVLVDDMGFADLSLTGNRRVATPNIDALARDGLVMTQFYDAAPICSPSRAAFLTGRFPARDRFVAIVSDRKRNRALNQADWLDPSLPTLASVLKGVGYATAHFGKWHLGGGRDIADAPWPAAYGFDESHTQFEGLGPRVLPIDIGNALPSESAALGRGPLNWLPRSQITADFVDKTLDFVRRYKHRPWFAQLWLDDVHTPWVPSQEQLALVKGRGRDGFEDKFLAVLVAMDAEIGRLVEGLRSAGALDDTLIVFTSDNGHNPRGQRQDSSGPYRGHKYTLYEGGVRQPLIVRWPGHIPAGAHDTTSVAHAVDLLPTFARIAGARKPAGTDGIDILGAWRGKSLQWRPDVYSHIVRPPQEMFYGPEYSVRSGPWKLLMEKGGGRAELYNIIQDPSELHDRKRDSPAILKCLSYRLGEWIATLPSSHPTYP